MPVDHSAFLVDSEIIDWKSASVAALASELKSEDGSVLPTAKRCFEWVRDNIEHSSDFKRNPVTCSASEVLQSGTGFCYAKSHLLCALLRASGIPAGLCYQRLSCDGVGPPYCLHGLNAVLLPEIGWYRVDARGNRDDISAEFKPPVEQLAFPVALSGESDLPEVWCEPLSIVVEALRRHRTWEALTESLPDIELFDGGI